MSLVVGTRLGPYEVLASIGAGGMGEVYRARDTRLNRDVALKVLPEAFASDPERLARFRREAQVLAALNHPRIAAIYGLEEADRVSALVLELVDGPTLADRIAHGPIPVGEALPLARQIAEALEAAHEQGIVHRDLKPANIKVTPDGIVKVLDFGLAKLAQAGGGGTPAAAGVDPLVALTQSPTMASPAMMTGVGVILGTAPYIAPEQAKGRPADKRSDVWAFGCVLYEMLTGTRAFEGGDVSETLAAILMRDPDWSALPSSVPGAVVRLLRRCLERDRTKRVGDVAAVIFALDELRVADATGGGVTRPEAQAQGWRRALPIAAAAAAAAALTGAGAWWTLRSAPPRVVRTTISTTGSAAVSINGTTTDVAITRDGSRVIYAGNNGTQLFVRGLDQLEPSVIATGAVGNVFVSPDDQWVGFGGTAIGLNRVSITGGPPVPITGVDGRLRGATWMPDDTIVFATDTPGTGLQRVAAAGGPVSVLSRPDRERGEADHMWPESLPDGRGVLFTITPLTGSLETAQVAVLNVADGTWKVVVRGGTHARYIPSGHLVFSAGSTLRAVAFDLDRLEISGNPVTVLPRLATAPTGAADFAVAADGTLLYVDAPAGFSGAVRSLVWVDRSGREEPISAPARVYMHPRVSPDGTRAALWVDDQESDIWIWDFARATLTRFTFEPGIDAFPAWTPDGRRIVFSSSRSSSDSSRPENLGLNLFQQSADGAGTVERVTGGQATQLLSGISPDGRWAIFNDQPGPTSRRDIRMVALQETGGSSPTATGRSDGQPLMQTPFEERSGIVAPNGRWLAYESNASGRAEIYVRPFPNVDAGQWQISTAGGYQPLWAPGGRELIYFAADGALMAVPVDAGGAAWSAGTPVKVLEPGYFTGGFGTVTTGRTYDVSPDGRRFLMIKQADSGNEGSAPPQIIVVQHWFEELRRLVPVN